MLIYLLTFCSLLDRLKDFAFSSSLLKDALLMEFLLLLDFLNESLFNKDDFAIEDLFLELDCGGEDSSGETPNLIVAPSRRNLWLSIFVFFRINGIFSDIPFSEGFVVNFREILALLYKLDGHIGSQYFILEKLCLGSG